MADPGVGAAAEDALGGRAEAFDVARAVERDDGIGHAVDDGPEALFLRRALAFGGLLQALHHGVEGLVEGRDLAAAAAVETPLVGRGSDHSPGGLGEPAQGAQQAACGQRAGDGGQPGERGAEPEVADLQRADRFVDHSAVDARAHRQLEAIERRAEAQRHEDLIGAQEDVFRLSGFGVLHDLDLTGGHPADQDVLDRHVDDGHAFHRLRRRKNDRPSEHQPGQPAWRGTARRRVRAQAQAGSGAAAVDHRGEPGTLFGGLLGEPCRAVYDLAREVRQCDHRIFRIGRDRGAQERQQVGFATGAVEQRVGDDRVGRHRFGGIVQAPQALLEAHRGNLGGIDLGAQQQFGGLVAHGDERHQANYDQQCDGDRGNGQRRARDERHRCLESGGWREAPAPSAGTSTPSARKRVNTICARLAASWRPGSKGRA